MCKHIFRKNDFGYINYIVYCNYIIETLVRNFIKIRIKYLYE